MARARTQFKQATDQRLQLRQQRVGLLDRKVTLTHNAPARNRPEKKKGGGQQAYHPFISS
jgi:hypothetical protein